MTDKKRRLPKNLSLSSKNADNDSITVDTYSSPEENNRTSSSAIETMPVGKTAKKKKNERRKIVETQIILNKMIASIYKQPVNSRSI